MTTSLAPEALALVGEISNAVRTSDESVPGRQSPDHRRLYDTVVRLSALLPTAEHLEAFSDAAGEDVAHWLLGLPFTLAGSGMPAEAAHLQRIWADRLGRAECLGDRAVVLGEAGLRNEALEQIEELDRQFPDDLWVQLKIGDALNALDEPHQAEARYRRGLGLAREHGDREGARERIVALLYDRVAQGEGGRFDLSRSDVAQLCEKLCAEPALTDEEIRAVLSAPAFFRPYFRIFLAHRALLKSAPLWDDDGTDAQAVFFLGDFGDGEMIPDLLTCLSMDADTLPTLYGDSLTEHMWIPIAKAGHARLDAIRAFVLNTRVDEFARLAVAAGVATMHRFHPERRADAVALLRELVQRGAGFPEDYLAGVLCDCGDNGLVELAGLAEEFAAGMAGDEPDQMASAGDVREAFQGGDQVLQRPGRATDVFGVNHQWRRWQEEHDREAARRAERTPDPETVMRPVSAEPKIGRNDPCPCGSGKKYKKCHGA